MVTGLFFIIGVAATVMYFVANRSKVLLSDNWQTVGTASLYAAVIAYICAVLLFSAGFTTGGVV